VLYLAQKMKKAGLRPVAKTMPLGMLKKQIYPLKGSIIISHLGNELDRLILSS